MRLLFNYPMRACVDLMKTAGRQVLFIPVLGVIAFSPFEAVVLNLWAMISLGLNDPFK